MAARSCIILALLLQGTWSIPLEVGLNIGRNSQGDGSGKIEGETGGIASSGGGLSFQAGGSGSGIGGKLAMGGLGVSGNIGGGTNGDASNKANINVESGISRGGGLQGNLQLGLPSFGYNHELNLGRSGIRIINGKAGANGNLETNRQGLGVGGNAGLQGHIKGRGDDEGGNEISGDYLSIGGKTTGGIEGNGNIGGDINANLETSGISTSGIAKFGGVDLGAYTGNLEELGQIGSLIGRLAGSGGSFDVNGLGGTGFNGKIGLGGPASMSGGIDLGRVASLNGNLGQSGASIDVDAGGLGSLGSSAKIGGSGGGGAGMNVNLALPSLMQLGRVPLNVLSSSISELKNGLNLASRSGYGQTPSANVDLSLSSPLRLFGLQQLVPQLKARALATADMGGTTGLSGSGNLGAKVGFGVGSGNSGSSNLVGTGLISNLLSGTESAVLTGINAVGEGAKFGVDAATLAALGLTGGLSTGLPSVGFNVRGPGMKFNLGSRSNQNAEVSGNLNSNIQGQLGGNLRTSLKVPAISYKAGSKSSVNTDKTDVSQQQ